ncbi:MAG: hypothetical protein ACK4TO_05940 [Candidatus Nitrosotenuis sp.]
MFFQISVANIVKMEDDLSFLYDKFEENFENCRAFRGKASAAAIDQRIEFIVNDDSDIEKITNALYYIWKFYMDRCELYIAVEPEKDAQIMLTKNTTPTDLKNFVEEVDRF